VIKEEEEEEERIQSEQAKSDCLLADEKKEEQHFIKIDSLDKVRSDINVTHTSIISDKTAISSFYENTSMTSAVKFKIYTIISSHSNAADK